jgi:ectoine hydroxylase-related dioxygenase (phytanoyl-CoA dioxygenase family)
MSIDAHYPLTTTQIEFFQEHGFVKLKQVLAPSELEFFGRELTRLTFELNTQTKPLEERSTYDKAFLQVWNLWELSEIARQFVFSKRLARIATELLRVAGVRLYHDQALYKEAYGGMTPAHCDQYYWPLSNADTVTVWVPLQAVPLEMGPLAFYSGSHRLSLGRDLEISDQSESNIRAHMEKLAIPLHEEPFDLGEVSFHRGWTFHRASANSTSRLRAAMTVIYMERNMKLVQPLNGHQRQDWEKWCPGAEVGKVIDTPRNPVLYPA